MKILYRTKEEANEEQEKAFLALSPEERFLSFLSLSRKILKFPINRTNKKQSHSSDFVIHLYDAK